MATELQVGDVGTAITVTVVKPGTSTPVDISSATVLHIILGPPGEGAAPVTKTAAFVTNGVDGKMQYVTQAGDLSAAGSWKVQGYFENPAGKWHTAKGKFKVNSNVG